MIWQGDKDRPTNNQLKRSAKTLRDIRKKSWEHRMDFLIRLEHRYKTLGENKKAEVVRKIRKTEMETRCWSICKNITKPKSEIGGFSHLIIQNEEGEKRIDDPILIQQSLRNKNITHFAQARNTPCANGELSRLLGETGISETTANALNNKVNENITPPTKEILAEIKQVRPVMKD
jgi:hypothetical protein